MLLPSLNTVILGLPTDELLDDCHRTERTISERGEAVPYDRRVYQSGARWPVMALLTVRAFYNGAVAIEQICVLDGACSDVIGA